MTLKSLYKDETFEWIDIVELKAEEIPGISQKYNINKLLLEDCIDPNHLPKFENLNDAIEEIATISKFFFHSKVIDYNPISGAAVVEFRGLAIDVIDPRNENEVV